jgi:hypothetical protein
LYLDKSKQEKNPIVRHRTVPSAHGYYPFHIYAVTPSGIAKYQPNLLVKLFVPVPVDFTGIPVISFLLKIRFGDHRDDIAHASSMPSIASAPLIIIPVLDLTLAKELAIEEAHRFWYYEAGAAAHNIMLQATPLGFSSNIALPTDTDAISTLLRLDEDCIPLLLVPVGV